MKLPRFRVLVFWWLGLAGGMAAAAETTRKPNILFIIADDLRPELGCYGVEGIKTPNIDGLAARSVRFNHAAAQYPLCNPSRSSLLTGHYPTQTGVTDNRQWWGFNHPEYISMPRWFKDHGYVTARAGKIFHDGIDDTAAWTEGGQVRTYADDAAENIDGARATVARKGGPAAGQTGERANGSDRFVVLPGEGEEYADYKHTTTAIEMMKQHAKGDQPFFIACGFANPHSPPRAPQSCYDLYDAKKMTLPPDFAHHPTVPAGFPELSVVPRNTDLFIGRDASEEQAREMIRAYWAATSFVDSLVGRLLKALDETGQRDNTIIVFWGDHGYHLGEKGRWSKAYSLFDVATRTPLLFAAPGVTAKSGAVCERPVEMINLYRTFCDLCGLPAPEGVEGVSMAPLLKNPAMAWDRPVYSVVQYREHFGRSVSTAQWHFAEWDGGAGGAMLLDRVNDPKELKNLAADGARAGELAAMKALLAKMPGPGK